jgi:hypothetical protein
MRRTLARTVLRLMLWAAIPPATRDDRHRRVFWWWGPTYQQADYVMDAAYPNQGAPYIAGHFEGSTEQHNLIASMQGRRSS